MEQIYKPLKDYLNWKKSTADMTVLSVAKIMGEQIATQILLDIWVMQKSIFWLSGQYKNSFILMQLGLLIEYF